MNKKEKKFDAVKWVREIRDKFYEEHKHLSIKEYMKAHLQEAEKSGMEKRTKFQKAPLKSTRKLKRKIGGKKTAS